MADTETPAQYPRSIDAQAFSYSYDLKPSDVQIVVDLIKATQEATDEFTPFMNAHTVGSMSDVELAGAVRDLKNETRRAQLKAAAEVIVRLDAKAVAAQQALVMAIRRARASEREALSSLQRMQRAMNYALATQNYLPLMALLGLIAPTGIGSTLATQVPAEWSEVPPDEGSSNEGDVGVRRRAKRSDAGKPRGPIKRQRPGTAGK